MASIEDTGANPLSAWLELAEAEIQRRRRNRVLEIPTNPTDALRLLTEYFWAAQDGFRRTMANPDGFAQMINVLAFHEELAPSKEWPFTQEQMQADLVDGGLNEWSHLPISHASTMFLIAPEQYNYTLVTFNPRLDDLWLTQHAQASISTSIETGKGWSTASATSVTQMRSSDAYSVHATASASGGVARVSGPEGVMETYSQGDLAAPARLEEQHTVMFDGSELHTAMSIDQHGTKIGRQVSLQKPFRSAKSIEEWTAGAIFTPAYNAENGSSWSLSKPPDDRDADLLLGPHRIQVRKCANEQTWKTLARSGAYADEQSEPEAMNEILAAVNDKKKHCYSNASELILLLDGGLTAVPHQTLEQMMTDQSESLANTGFREVWYVSRATGKAVCLSPLSNPNTESSNECLRIAQTLILRE